MKVHRVAGATLLCLLGMARVSSPVAYGVPLDDEVATRGSEAPLFRVFLKDGTTLVSYGELARVADRVVFSMPTSTSVENPQLHLVDISSDRVDWERTFNYADAARARRYLATRAESDYAMLTTEIAQALNDVALTTDPVRRLAIVERARKTLADWPPRHYNYKQAEVRQMLGMLDEAIADLRAASGARHFDLSLVAAVEAPPLVEPLLPAPTPQEVIEQMLAAATLSEAAAERTSLLAVALAAIDRDAEHFPVEWATATRTAATAAMTREIEIDRAYGSLRRRVLRLADQRARAADVRGVQRLLAQTRTSDEALGRERPDTVSSIFGILEEQLNAARRLRLERDRWALRLPELRSYRESMGSSLQKLVRLGPALEDIKTLAGSGPDALGTILKAAADVLRIAQRIHPPDELKDVHSLLLSATQLAGTAARFRREAALTGDMSRAWDASSAAAGALMLSERARSEMQSALRLPQLPR